MLGGLPSGGVAGLGDSRGCLEPGGAVHDLLGKCELSSLFWGGQGAAVGRGPQGVFGSQPQQRACVRREMGCIGWGNCFQGCFPAWLRVMPAHLPFPGRKLQRGRGVGVAGYPSCSWEAIPGPFARSVSGTGVGVGGHTLPASLACPHGPQHGRLRQHCQRRAGRRWF